MAEMMMIERIARAMSRGVQNRTVGAELAESETWQTHRELTVDREWRHYEHFARDAVEAMREYTKSMEDSYVVYAHDSLKYGNSPTIPGGWRKMINAALSEQP